MIPKNPNLVFILSILVSAGCAKQGILSGGPKDEEGPKLVRSVPENETKEFKDQTITLQFNELIRIDNPLKNILLTPRIPGEIEFTVKKKTLTISIPNVLENNTTYRLTNTGGITDLSEKNKSGFDELVFSTGEYIDSISLTASYISHASVNPANIKLLLYESNSFTDTTPPYYTGKFSENNKVVLRNLKSGVYKVIALEDINDNNKYESDKEKIGFITEDLVLEKDKTVDTITLFFNNETDLKLLNSKETGSYLILSYNKAISKVFSHGQNLTWMYHDETFKKIRIYPSIKENFNFPITAIDSFENKSDTILGFLLSGEIGSIDKIKFNHRLIETKIYYDWDFKGPIINLPDSFVTFPLEKEPVKHTESIIFFDKIAGHFESNAFSDSVALTLRLSKLNFHNLTSTLSDTSIMIYKTSESGFGSLSFIVITETPNYVIEILNAKGALIKRELSSKILEVKHLEPGQYTIRAIIDTNKDGNYTPGSLKNWEQPDRVINYPESILIKGNWSVEGLIFKF